MGGPKGCKAVRGTEKMADATLTNRLITATRSSDDDDDDDAVLLLLILLLRTGPRWFCCIHGINVYEGTMRIYDVINTSEKIFILISIPLPCLSRVVVVTVRRLFPIFLLLLSFNNYS